MREIQVVFGIDMETDIGSWTPFYDGVIKGTPLLLNLFAKKSIPVTAFWVADTAQRFPKIVREMESAGHETGTHSLYHETVGDSLFEIPGSFPLLPEEVQPRIKLATDILEDIVGHKVVSWRCPRLFGGTHVTTPWRPWVMNVMPLTPCIFTMSSFSLIIPVKKTGRNRGV